MRCCLNETTVSRVSIRLGVLAAAAVLVQCGGSSPVEVTTPTPTATKAATATPSPSPTPFVCPLGRGTGDGQDCARKKADPGLFSAMENAIDTAERTHPEYFTRNSDGTIHVNDQAGYYKAVIGALNDSGLCAVDDGYEIGVKWTNDFSEQYTIWVSSSGNVRRDPTIYRATCEPAWF